MKREALLKVIKLLSAQNKKLPMNELTIKKNSYNLKKSIAARKTN